MVYLKKHSDKESKTSEYVIIGRKGVGHTYNDHRPLTQQKDRFASELVRQSGRDHSAKHPSGNEYRLCEVLEIGSIADQVPLHKKVVVVVVVVEEYLAYMARLNKKTSNCISVHCNTTTLQDRYVQ